MDIYIGILFNESMGVLMDIKTLWGSRVQEFYRKMFREGDVT
jgi:ABC-2 type transport system permease protein